jgi:hypothetical protein
LVSWSHRQGTRKKKVLRDYRERERKKRGDGHRKREERRECHRDREGEKISFLE